MIAINTPTAMDYLGESGIGAWSGPIARNLLQSDFRLGVTVPICRGLLMVDEHIICWNSWRAAASEQTLTECGNAPEGI